MYCLLMDDTILGVNISEYRRKQFWSCGSAAESRRHAVVKQWYAVVRLWLVCVGCSEC